jgi:hypothetical protein
MEYQKTSIKEIVEKKANHSRSISGNVELDCIVRTNPYYNEPALLPPGRIKDDVQHIDLSEYISFQIGDWMSEPDLYEKESRGEFVKYTPNSPVLEQRRQFVLKAEAEGSVIKVRGRIDYIPGWKEEINEIRPIIMIHSAERI